MREAEALVKSGELSQALLKRLHLDAAKLAEMVRGVRAVAELPDPSGRILERRLLDTGLELHKVSCPLGVLAVIFEARPDAVTQISALSVKSGNAVILKGGREVERTTEILVSTMRKALANTAVPADAICAVYGREAVASLLAMDDSIDLVIPRGSNALVQHIQRSTRIPVLGHADGVCHAYVDSAADQEMALVDRGGQQGAISSCVQCAGDGADRPEDCREFSTRIDEAIRGEERSCPRLYALESDRAGDRAHHRGRVAHGVFGHGRRGSHRGRS